PASLPGTPTPGGAAGGGRFPGGGGTVESTPVAGTPVAGASTREPLIRTVIGPLPSEVPVLPVLLPLFAGLLLLLVSAMLAAYRRTQEARRFEALERTKSDFMKLASHELRTPLTVLRGYISLIRDGDIKPNTPTFDRVLPILEDRLNQV